MDLILFTNTFPYLKSEQFLVNEFDFTVKRFDSISIYTLTSGTKLTNINVEPNININPPVFKNHKSKFELLYKGLFSFASVKYHIKDFFSAKLYIAPSKWRSFIVSLLVTRAAMSTPVYSSLVKKINESGDEVILYFYWGDNLCWILPYLNEDLTNNRVKAVIRFHRTDLYEYLNYGYAPLRKYIFKAAHTLVPISMDGFKYLTDKYPEYKNRTRLSKLGVFDKGLNPYHTTGRFTLVSVSFVTPVKQVGLILEALKLCREKIDWYHFGDGPLFNAIKNRISELPSNIAANMHGYTKNEDIMEFYKSKCVDLFINVSKSEGLPVSIMEAASFGIPIIATDAGGTSEIVNSETGKLIKVEITAEQLSSEISAFLSLPAGEIMQHRIHARRKFETELNAKTNYSEFYNKIMVIN